MLSGGAKRSLRNISISCLNSQFTYLWTHGRPANPTEFKNLFSAYSSRQPDRAGSAGLRVLVVLAAAALGVIFWIKVSIGKIRLSN